MFQLIWLSVVLHIMGTDFASLIHYGDAMRWIFVWVTALPQWQFGTCPGQPARSVIYDSSSKGWAWWFCTAQFTLRSCEVCSLLAIIVDMQAFNKMPMNSGYCVYQLGVDSCLNIIIIVLPSESSHQYLWAHNSYSNGINFSTETQWDKCN